MEIEERILIYALKYALGRNGSEVDDVISFIRNRELTVEERVVIIAELEYFKLVAEAVNYNKIERYDDWNNLLHFLKNDVIENKAT